MMRGQCVLFTDFNDDWKLYFSQLNAKAAEDVQSDVQSDVHKHFSVAKFVCCVCSDSHKCYIRQP